MEEFIKSLLELDIHTIIVVGLAFWFLKNHQDKKFDKVDQRFDKVDQRFDKLEEKITDIDRRVCRIEGSLSSKECCILKDDRAKQRAE